MIFKLLNKDGTKNLRNVLMYLSDTKTIENEGIKTKMGNKGNRKDIIINSFKNLNDENKKELIKHIKDKENIISEFIEAYSKFRELDEREGISKFLSDLMINIDDEKLKIEIYTVIFINDNINALNIILRAKPDKFKKKLCQQSISVIPERGYIYGLLNNIDMKLSESLDVEKLIDEINDIQFSYDKSILEIIINNSHYREDLINEINQKIKLEDFKTFYTLAKNLKILDSHEFDVSKKELAFLKWIIDNLDLKQGNKISDKVIKEGIKEDSDNWLIFLSLNLLKLDPIKQNFAIAILNETIKRESIKNNYSDKLAEEISLRIIENNTIRNDLFRILIKLDTSKGFYNVVKVIEKEGLKIIKNPNIVEYIDKNIKNTDEYIWFDEVKNFNKYINSKKQLNSKILTLIIRKKTIKEIYDLLVILKENNKKIYNNIMKDFVEFILNKIDDERYIKLIKILDYKCKDKKISNYIDEYYDKNIERMEILIKTLDPKLLEKQYVQKILLAIEEKDNKKIVKILNETEDIEIKKTCSISIIEQLEEDRLGDIIDLWDSLYLDIANKLSFREKLFVILSKKETVLTEGIITFADKVGVEPVELYKIIDDEEKKNYLLNQLYESDRRGTIINIIKDKVINQINCLEDIKYIDNLIERYNINDNNLLLLIKIKVYTFITLELLKLNVESEEAPIILNDLIDKLCDYDLIDRFLMDGLIRKELDNRAVDYIIRKLIENINSNDLLEIYWEDIVSDINNGKHINAKEKMDIFFGFLKKSRERIEWFLDIIDNTNTTKEINVNVFETLLILLNKDNRTILQNKKEMEMQQDQLLNDLVKEICNPLGTLEKTIINKNIDIENDTIIENIKKLRRGLESIGIGTVEDMENYGHAVEFDNTKHENNQFKNIQKGIVDSLGIRIKDNIIIPSTLLDID